VIPTTVVVMIVPIALCVPAMLVFIPPSVDPAPAILARLMQLVTRMLRLWTVPSMMFSSFVKPVVGLDKAMPAIIVIGNRARGCSKEQESAHCSRGQHTFPDQSDTSRQKRLHQSIPPIVRSGMGLAGVSASVTQASAQAVQFCTLAALPPNEGAPSFDDTNLRLPHKCFFRMQLEAKRGATTLESTISPRRAGSAVRGDSRWRLQQFTSAQ